jgi:hypothetical protein
MRAKFIYLFFINSISTLVSTTNSVAAEINCVFSSEAGVRLESYEYRETDNNNQLIDKEDGLLPGLALGLAATCNQWEFAVRGVQQRARLEYDGQTNTGRKFLSRTMESIGDLSVQVGRRFLVNDTNSVGVYGGVGYWQWQRNIASGGNVSGLDEKYRWRYYYLGSNVALIEQKPHQLLFDIRWLRMTQAKLSVDFLGVFDKPEDLSLDVRNGWRVAIPWQYMLNLTNTIRVEPYAQGWRIPRSDAKPLSRSGVVVGDFFEPASQTRAYGINATWSHLF